MTFLTYNQAGISPRIGVYLPPKMLANAQPWLVLQQFAEKQTLPKNKGETIKWRRAVPFDVSTTTLVEGVTPPPQNFRYEGVTDSVDQYGTYVVISDKIQDLHEDRVLNDIARELGKQMASTKELISWEAIRAGTQVIYSGTATSRATVEDVMTINQVRQAVSVLKGNHAEMLTGRIAASTNYGTEPIAPAYVAVGPKDLQYDIEDLEGFVPVEKYGSVKPLTVHELGSTRECRYVLTPDLPPFYGAGSATTTGVLTRDGTNVDVFPLIVMGKSAWGTTELSGLSDVDIHVEAPGKKTKDDPLGQRGFASYVFWYCTTRLNERWMERIETAATDQSA